MPAQELKRHLISLLMAKIVTKEPRGRELRPDDKYQINEAYASKMYKQRIPLGNGGKEVQAVERKELDEKIDDDRRHRAPPDRERRPR